MIAIYTDPGAPGIEASNPFSVNGGTASLELKGGFVTTIDVNALPVVAPYRWHYDHGYASTPKLKGGNPRTRLHRLLLGGSDPNAVVDHINGDRLDNHKANLRFCSPQENWRNSASAQGSSVEFKGVDLYMKTGRFRARIHPDGKQKHLGFFATAEQAARAYDAAALEHFGKFARLNFPPFPTNARSIMPSIPPADNSKSWHEQEASLTPEKIGEEISRTRFRMGINLCELAEITGVCRAVLREIEVGKPNCQLYALLKVLNALGIMINLTAPDIAKIGTDGAA